MNFLGNHFSRLCFSRSSPTIPRIRRTKNGHPISQMPVSISRLIVDQDLLLAFLLDFKAFVECLVGEDECELIVAFCIFDFALALATAEGN